MVEGMHVYHHSSILFFVLCTLCVQSDAAVIRVKPGGGSLPGFPDLSDDLGSPFAPALPEYGIGAPTGSDDQSDLIRLSQSLEFLLKMGNFESALMKVEQLLILQPENVGLRSLNAWLLFQLKQYAEAEASIARLHYAKPENQSSLTLELLGASQVMQKKFPAAMRTYKTAIHFSKDTSLQQFRLGWIALHEGDLENAEVYLKASLEGNPKNAMTHDLFGLVAYQAGRFQESVDAHKASLALNPKQPEVWNHLGSAQYQVGDQEQAIESYKKALGINPRLGEARSNLGAAFSANGEIDAAFLELSTALDFNLSDPLAWKNMMVLVQQQYKDVPGVTNALAVLSSNFNHAPSHEFLARALSSTNTVSPSFLFCRSSHLLAPTDLDALTILNDVLRANKDSRDVRTLKTRWVRRAEKDVTNSLYSAECAVLFDAIGEKEDAIKWMKKALKHQPANAAHRFELARLFDNIGNRPAALEQLELLIGHSPNNHDAHFRYAWLLMQIPMASQEQQVKALQLINRANQLTGYSREDYLRTQVQAANLAGIDQGELRVLALREAFLKEQAKATAPQPTE